MCVIVTKYLQIKRYLNVWSRIGQDLNSSTYSSIVYYTPWIFPYYSHNSIKCFHVCTMYINELQQRFSSHPILMLYSFPWIMHDFYSFFNLDIWGRVYDTWQVVEMKIWKHPLYTLDVFWNLRISSHWASSSEANWWWQCTLHTPAGRFSIVSAQ